MRTQAETPRWHLSAHLIMMADSGQTRYTNLWTGMRTAMVQVQLCSVSRHGLDMP